MAGAYARVHVEGLDSLLRAFNRFDKDLTQDLVDTLAEAADPVRKTTVEYVVSGGGGFPAIRGIATSSERGYWSSMRIGVSRSAGEVYIAPGWRSNKGTPQGATLAGALSRRMEGAIEDKADVVEDRMGDWLDELADNWGSHLT
jgi:hypothetical protein